MESSKAVCLIAFVVVFLFTFSPGGRGEGEGLMGFNNLANQAIHTLEGLMGFNNLANQGDVDNKDKACCDFAVCAFSQCRCYDVGTTCHAACKDCICSKFNPPQCYCFDVTPYSYGRCTCSASS